MNNIKKLRTALALTTLIAFFWIVSSHHPIAANEPVSDTSIIGTWNWSFNQSRASNAPDPRPQGTVTFDENHKMSWSGGRKGTWEGPYPEAVLLRWKKGAIDMLKVENNHLRGINNAGLIVQGDKNGGSIYGSWAWSFGPSGNVVRNGDVELHNDSDQTMKWTTNGDTGNWEGPKYNAVLLRWNGDESIDMLELKGGTLTGVNAKGWTVKGTR